jgi:hypothetical protein
MNIKQYSLTDIDDGHCLEMLYKISGLRKAKKYAQKYADKENVAVVLIQQSNGGQRELVDIYRPLLDREQANGASVGTH